MAVGQGVNSFICTLSQALSAGGSETNIYISKVTTITGETIVTGDFSVFGKGVLTVDPLSSSNLEFISFTGVDGTNIAFTGATRGLSAFDYTSSTSRAKYHPAGTQVIISFGTHNLSDLLTYVNNLMAGSVGNASSTVAGVTKLSINPASPTSPVAAGANNTASGTAISSTNNLLDAGYISTLIPSGVVWGYGGTSAPTGWLLCDGSAVSRTTYANLFTAISTNFGTGDGSTTFNVPDYRGRTPIGSGTGTKTFTYSSGTTTYTITGATNSSSNEIQTGQPFVFKANGSSGSNLTDNTTYYFVRSAYNQFQVSSTLANAQNGTVITTAAPTGGTPTFVITWTARTVGDTGGQESHAMSSTELLAHTHSYNAPTGASQSGASGIQTTSSGATTGSTGGNAAMPTMSPFCVYTYIIKT